MKALGKSIVVFDLIFNLICRIAAGLRWKLILAQGVAKALKTDDGMGMMFLAMITVAVVTFFVADVIGLIQGKKGTGFVASGYIQLPSY